MFEFFFIYTNELYNCILLLFYCIQFTTVLSKNITSKYEQRYNDLKYRESIQ